MERKDFAMEIKALEEDGTFEGWLSVYDVIDYGGDVVEHGAFTKTLKESGGKLLLLWQHKTDSPIGAALLEDGDEGLKAKGHLNLEVTQAKEVHSMMKFVRKFGLKLGLSIGFATVKDAVEKGVRVLKEIKLFEGSVVTLPMNRFALVTDVKAMNGAEAKDFNDQLETIQTWSLHYQLLNALSYALEEEIGYYAEGDKATRLANIQTTLSQFVTAYLEYAPRLMDAMGVKCAAPLEHKDIEPNSDKLKTVAEKILALCGKPVSTSTEAADVVESKAAGVQPEPVGDHSELIQIPAW
jgi:hypothetical protein